MIYKFLAISVRQSPKTNTKTAQLVDQEMWISSITSKTAKIVKIKFKH